MRIYLASSWRNAAQPGLVALLRSWGHEVYDFRNPAPGETGFAWQTDWRLTLVMRCTSDPDAWVVVTKDDVGAAIEVLQRAEAESLGSEEITP